MLPGKFLFISLFVSTLVSAQGPYAPAAGQPGSTAVHRDSTIIVGWASTCTVFRGYLDISDKQQGMATFGAAGDGVGYADGAVVSLGDSGVAVLGFDDPIFNGVGYDFAVYENSFSDNFLELAQVSVSSNGVDFFTFPSHSLTPDTGDIGGFGTTDPTDINNLAGKYRAQYGTPFDLSEMTGIPGLDVNNITHIRLVDVVGTVDSNFSIIDTAGNTVVDPYPTNFASGGFDLDGVAAMYQVSINGVEEFQDFVSVYPNPCRDVLKIAVSNARVRICNMQGRIVFDKALIGTSQIGLSGLPSGCYIVSAISEDRTKTIRLVKQ